MAAVRGVRGSWLTFFVGRTERPASFGTPRPLNDDSPTVKDAEAALTRRFSDRKISGAVCVI